MQREEGMSLNHGDEERYWDEMNDVLPSNRTENEETEQRERLSDLWKKRFQEKQAWKAWFGGWSEKKGRRFFLGEKTYEESFAKVGRTVQNILVETGWARSPMQARIWVRDGKIQVRGQVIQNPHYLLQPGDWIEGTGTVREALREVRPYWWNQITEGLSCPDLSKVPNEWMAGPDRSSVAAICLQGQSLEKTTTPSEVTSIGLSMHAKIASEVLRVIRRKVHTNPKERGVEWDGERLLPGGQTLEAPAVLATGYGWLDVRAGRFVLTSMPRSDQHLSPFQVRGFQESFQLARQFYRKQRL